MRAYSMDLRVRALHDSDAGLKAADVAAKYHVSGSWVRLLKQRRRETGEVAPRAQRSAAQTGAAPPPAGRVDSGATRSDAGGIEGRAGRERQSGDDLAGGDRPRLHHQKKRYARPNTIGQTFGRPASSGSASHPRSIRRGSSFSMKVGSPPICSAGMPVGFVGSGSPITRRRATGRRARSSPRCA
jgi:hypothetical protein